VTRLDVTGNLLSGSLPDLGGDVAPATDASGMPAHLSILLGYNRLVGKVDPDRLPPHAFAIELRHNLLSGTLHPDLGRLTDLSTLTIDTNLFSGTIPDTLGNLTLLHRLTLESNRLSGTLPATLDGLTRLETCALVDDASPGVDDNLFSCPLPSTLPSACASGAGRIPIPNTSFSCFYSPPPVAPTPPPAASTGLSATTIALVASGGAVLLIALVVLAAIVCRRRSAENAESFLRNENGIVPELDYSPRAGETPGASGAPQGSYAAATSDGKPGSTGALVSSGPQ